MSENTEKKPFWAVFSITDRASCEKAIRNGGITATISAGITAVFAGIGYFSSYSNEDLAYLLDPWLTVDVVLIVILGIFIFRRSRTAATIMVLYFAVSKAIMWFEIGAMNGLYLSIIFFMFYFTAMRGTYIWHKTYKNPTKATHATDNVATKDVYTELLKLDDLRQKNIISQDEFEALKKKFLDTST